VPRDLYLSLAKQAWPQHVDKLDGWAADYTAATGKAVDLVSKGDFFAARIWIHKVGEYGCVSGFAQFAAKESDVKTQFAENEACRVLDTETTCVAPCKYQGPPPPPECASFGSDPNQCPTDRCEFNTGSQLCQEITTTTPPTTEPCASFTDAASCPADRCGWDTTNLVCAETGTTGGGSGTDNQCDSFVAVADCPTDRCQWVSDKCVEISTGTGDDSTPKECSAMTETECSQEDRCVFEASSMTCRELSFVEAAEALWTRFASEKSLGDTAIEGEMEMLR